MPDRNDLSKQVTSIALLNRSINDDTVCSKADDA